MAEPRPNPHVTGQHSSRDAGPARALVHGADPRPRVRRAARALAIGAEVRSVLPTAPRRPAPADLLFLARSLVRDAVRAEFVREGVEAVDLPADFRRADLLSAELLTDRDVLAFFDRTVAVLDAPAPVVDAREAAATAAAPTSYDAAGITLEGARALAGYLLDAAARCQGLEDAEREESVREQRSGLRAAAREMLGALVTAPQELRAALELRRAIDPAPEGETPNPPASAPRAAGASAPRADSQPSHASGSTGGARERTSSTRRERLRPADIRRVLDHADAARAFLDSEAGRATADLLRRGSAAVRERASERRERPRPERDAQG